MRILAAVTVCCGLFLSACGVPSPAAPGVPGIPGGSSGDDVGSPVDAGTGFVFGIADAFSNEPLAIGDATLAHEDETPVFSVLHDGVGRLPSRHSSGQVVVTVPCSREGSLVEYRQVAVLVADGQIEPLTPCSHSIDSPVGFTWIEEGQLSPDGRRLVAQLTSPGVPGIAVVFEGGVEIARYEGFHRSAWIDDNTLAMAGSSVVVASVGSETVIPNQDATGAIGAIAVAPDGSRLVFELNQGLWVMNTDGSGLRELLPPDRYLFPAWSPDGQWVATMQRQGPGPFDHLLVGDPSLVGSEFVFTNLQTLTLVHVDSGDMWYSDLGLFLDDTQMPQGRLTWY